MGMEENVLAEGGYSEELLRDVKNFAGKDQAKTIDCLDARFAAMTGRDTASVILPVGVTRVLLRYALVEEVLKRQPKAGVSRTELQPISRGGRSAVSSTELVYGAMAGGFNLVVTSRAAAFLVLPAISLRRSYAVPGTEEAYGATRTRRVSYCRKVAAYARAMRCPERLRTDARVDGRRYYRPTSAIQVSGTDLPYGAMAGDRCDGWGSASQGPIGLRARYAMFGTDIAHDATRRCSYRWALSMPGQLRRYLPTRLLRHARY
eukprot:3535644-Rhodomonas_salina.2